MFDSNFQVLNSSPSKAIIDVATQLLVVAACGGGSDSSERQGTLSANTAWEAFIQVFVLGLPESMRFDEGLGKVTGRNATPFTQDAVSLGIAVENRIPNHPASLGLAEGANDHLARVFDRLLDEGLGNLCDQERADIAALEWNSHPKIPGDFAPTELVTGKRFHASTPACYCVAAVFLERSVNQITDVDAA